MPPRVEGFGQPVEPAGAGVPQVHLEVQPGPRRPCPGRLGHLTGDCQDAQLHRPQLRDLPLQPHQRGGLLRRREVRRLQIRRLVQGCADSIHTPQDRVIELTAMCRF